MEATSVVSKRLPLTTSPLKSSYWIPRLSRLRNTGSVKQRVSNDTCTIWITFTISSSYWASFALLPYLLNVIKPHHCYHYHYDLMITMWWWQITSLTTNREILIDFSTLLILPMPLQSTVKSRWCSPTWLLMEAALECMASSREYEMTTGTWCLESIPRTVATRLASMESLMDESYSRMLGNWSSSSWYRSLLILNASIEFHETTC